VLYHIWQKIWRNVRSKR